MNRQKHLSVETSLNVRSCLFVLSLLPLLIPGCTHRNNYKSSLYEIEPERIPPLGDLESKPAVAIVNAQPDKTLRELGRGAKGRVGSMGYHRYYASPNEITAAVVRQLSHELKNRGMNVSDNAAKRIQLKVRRVEFLTGAWMLRVDMAVNVRAGKDYVRDVTVSNKTPGSIWARRLMGQSRLPSSKSSMTRKSLNT